MARAAARISVDQLDLRPHIRMAWFGPLLGTFLKNSPAQTMPTGAGMLTCASQLSDSALSEDTCSHSWYGSEPHGGSNTRGVSRAMTRGAAGRTNSARKEPTIAATHTTMMANAEPRWPGKNGFPMHKYRPADAEQMWAMLGSAGGATRAYGESGYSPAYTSKSMTVMLTALATSAADTQVLKEGLGWELAASGVSGRRQARSERKRGSGWSSRVKGGVGVIGRERMPRHGGTL